VVDEINISGMVNRKSTGPGLEATVGTFRHFCRRSDRSRPGRGTNSALRVYLLPSQSGNGEVIVPIMVASHVVEAHAHGHAGGRPYQADRSSSP